MKLKKALGLFSEKYKDPSVCESCGEDFICGAALTGCWCTEIKLSKESIADLKTKFTGCLCRKCLMRISEAIDIT